MPKERSGVGSRSYIPQPDGLVTGRGRHGTAIGRKGYRKDPIRMPQERSGVGSRSYIPQPDGSVTGRGRHDTAIGRKGYRKDPILMPDTGINRPAPYQLTKAPAVYKWRNRQQKTNKHIPANPGDRKNRMALMLSGAKATCANRLEPANTKWRVHRPCPTVL